MAVSWSIHSFELYLVNASVHDQCAVL